MNPYIGITDFATLEQVKMMHRLFVLNLPATSDLQLHVGVMMSRKTLNGLETSWSSVFPPKEVIRGILSHGATFNCLHYVDKEGIDVVKNLLAAMRYGGEGMDAIQLDMTWPVEPDVQQALETYGRKIEVILQVGEEAMDLCRRNPADVARAVHLRSAFVTRVLLDTSMGRGLAMNSSKLLPYIRAIKDRTPEMGIVVAGGLGPGTVQLIEPILKEFPDISIDAQSRLRKSGSARDPIDWNLASDYILEAIALMMGHGLHSMAGTDIVSIAVDICNAISAVIPFPMDGDKRLKWARGILAVLDSEEISKEDFVKAMDGAIKEGRTFDRHIEMYYLLMVAR